jgi:phosphatidylserine/phosphatidylglycerophosphate/cardiolipin synthase-like enzyme
MRKHISVILLLTALFFLFSACSSLHSFQGSIYTADNREYAKQVLPHLKKTEKSIYIIMFLASYYPQYPDSPTNLFIRELIDAKKRGVDVQVILNQSDSDYSSHSTTENLKTGAYLANNGITVYFDSPKKTTHAKILIIDEKLVVIGSANWSYSAMAKNNETSVIIDSPELAKSYIKYFEEIKKECRPFLSLPRSP